MTRNSTIITTLDLITRPARFATAGTEDDRLNACVLASATEAASAAGFGDAETGIVTWLGEDNVDAWTFLFDVALWVNGTAVDVRVTAQHDEVMFFFYPDDYAEEFPPTH